MTSFEKQIEWIEKNFREIKDSEQVSLQLKYATADNFMNRDVYQGFDRCFVAPIAYDMFMRACEELKRKHPTLKFLIWDALRPRSIQAEFYKHLEGTPFQNYVAPPHPGSLHNFGMAMDLTLIERDGDYLDMGTGFDDFRELAQPKLEQQFLKSGELSNLQFSNRMILRNLMEDQGFKVLEHEWWHFNALPKDQVHGKHLILE
ncbi:M15 family metallopeptidase [Bdellovibrio sp. SKB1291214]|uniref:M15 family metallopeptidase n=1 Tax=Bdellovibrio sp. SKB1291214 TaxID=1732569 RepID=UPI000B51841B|nr:M15 family metallopeptidase [Bdellovibrio sp. SKB1291214]UYL09399.1 M15 family metallopeptidase [Bdellovibrio sp. SKB1291214]